jgi:DNA helicase IV
VVDEAQDLSAMELRLVARRTPERSLTVLGDLAQATTVGAQQSWDEAMAALGHGKSDARGIERQPQTGYISPLLLGYRVPETLLAFANQLLPVAAPHVQRSRSVRTGGAGPSLLGVNAPEVLLDAVVAEAVRLHADVGLVGVLAPATMVTDVAQAFGAAGISALDITKHGAIEQGIALVGAEAAKGLEFDAVVVVEPAAIVASGLLQKSNGQRSEAQGYRILFVALTRATQQVSIVHYLPLPAELRLVESIEVPQAV